MQQIGMCNKIKRPEKMTNAVTVKNHENIRRLEMCAG